MRSLHEEGGRGERAPVLSPKANNMHGEHVFLLTLFPQERYGRFYIQLQNIAQFYYVDEIYLNPKEEFSEIAAAAAVRHDGK